MAYQNQYSSKDCSIVWGGNPLLGLAPDTAVTVARNEARTETEVGMDGRPVTSIHPNDSVIVTLTFQQESDGNRTLSSLDQDQQVRRYLLEEPMIILINTGEKVVVQDAHIQNVPERSWGSVATGSGRAWEFFGIYQDWETFANFRGISVNTTNIADLFGI